MRFTINLTFFACICSFLQFTKSSIIRTKEVYISQGAITGVIEKGIGDTTYEAFYGIPYGSPPIGPNRFANFKPIAEWEGILHAVEPKPVCIQKNVFNGELARIKGEEDCLYLNIYRPMNSKEAELLPVIVYIPGGGFFSNGADPQYFGPKKFMKSGKVILVVIQYRLGPLGFLSTNDDAAEGNQGFKDQQGALDFIYHNIQHFNGNPQKITLAGHGAGAVSVHLHMMNAKSNVLFQRAIILSGSGLAPIAAPVENPVNQVRQLVEYSGISDAEQLSTKEMIEKLRELDAATILNSAYKFHTHGIDPVVVFRLVVENSKNPDTFITKHPKEYSKNGEMNYVPVLMGFIENEGSVRTVRVKNDQAEIDRINSKFEENLRVLMAIDDKEIVEKILKHYLDNDYLITPDRFEGFEKLISDLAFLYPFYEMLLHFIEFSNEPVIVYKYDNLGSRTFWNTYAKKKGLPPNDHPVHGDELLHLFDYDIMTKTENTSCSDCNSDENNFEDDHSFFNYVLKFITTDNLRSFQHCESEWLKYQIKLNKICHYTQFNNGLITLNDTFRVADMTFWEDTMKFFQINK